MVENYIERLITCNSYALFKKDYNSSFNDLLKNDKSVCIHHRNIQSLAIELFKVKENLSDLIMSDIFSTRVSNYNLRLQTDFIEIQSIPQNFI